MGPDMIGVYHVSASIILAPLFINKQKRSVFMVPFILSRPDLQELTGCRHSLVRKEMVLIFKHHHTKYTG